MAYAPPTAYGQPPPGQYPPQQYPPQQPGYPPQQYPPQQAQAYAAPPVYAQVPQPQVQLLQLQCAHNGNFMNITGKPGRGNFVSARAGNEGWRIVQGNVGREWETFTAIPNPANPRQVTLRTAHNKYVSSEPNGVLSGSADAPNAWSLFELVSLGPGRTAVLSCAHRTYLSALPDGNIFCNRPDLKECETFNVVYPGVATSVVTTTTTTAGGAHGRSAHHQGGGGGVSGAQVLGAIAGGLLGAALSGAAHSHGNHKHLNHGGKIHLENVHTNRNLRIKGNGKIDAQGGNGGPATWTVHRFGNHFKFKNQAGHYLAIKGDSVCSGGGGGKCELVLQPHNGNWVIRSRDNRAGIAFPDGGHHPKAATHVGHGQPAQFRIKRA